MNQTTEYKYEKYLLQKIEKVLDNENLEYEQQILLIMHIIESFREDHKPKPKPKKKAKAQANGSKTPTD